MTHELNVNDLVAMKQLIETTAARGAFTNVKEFQTVGALYQRLEAYLAAYQLMQETPKKQPAANGTTTDTPEGGI